VDVSISDPVDINPSTYNARSGVHEYGGASGTARGGIVVYTDFADRRLFAISSDATVANLEPQPLTPKNSALRYADANIHPNKDHLAVVQEEHVSEHNVLNRLAVVSISSANGAFNVSEPRVIASGRDFYSAPRFSPNGKYIAWIQWDLPEMPWTKSTLVIAEWDESAQSVVGTPKLITSGKFSVSQPRWNGDMLYFASDETGY
jgi:hypothetical protein